MGGSESKHEVATANAVIPSFSDKTTDTKLNNHAQADDNTPILIVLSYKDIANLKAGADTREQQLFEYLFSLIKQYKNANTRDVRILLADTLQKHNGVEEAQLRAWVDHFCSIHGVRRLMSPPAQGPAGTLQPEGFANPVGVYLWEHYRPRQVKTFITHFRAALNGVSAESLKDAVTVEQLQKTFQTTCKNIAFKPGLPDSAIDQLLKDALFQAVSRTALSYPDEISNQIQYDDALQTNIHELIAKLPESIKTAFQAKLINNLLYILEETLTVIALQNQNLTHIYYAGRIPKHHPTCTLPDFYVKNAWDFVSLSSFSLRPMGAPSKRGKPTQKNGSSTMDTATQNNDGRGALAPSQPIAIKSTQEAHQEQGGSLDSSQSSSSSGGSDMLKATTNAKEFNRWVNSAATAALVTKFAQGEAPDGDFMANLVDLVRAARNQSPDVSDDEATIPSATSSARTSEDGDAEPTQVERGRPAAAVVRTMRLSKTPSPPPAANVAPAGTPASKTPSPRRRGQQG